MVSNPHPAAAEVAEAMEFLLHMKLRVRVSSVVES